MGTHIQIEQEILITRGLLLAVFVWEDLLISLSFKKQNSVSKSIEENYFWLCHHVARSVVCIKRQINDLL